MEDAANLPLWAAIFIAAFLILGSGLALIGAIGLVRFTSFYERLHAPTLTTSWGTAAIMLASILFFSVLGGRFVLHEILIGIFVTITTPITLMLLARAALHRDRFEQAGDFGDPVSKEDHTDEKQEELAEGRKPL
ncbi:monovalent cation/H(+) antiporter subunit G [Limoniibacter endophyticus]|nr:monovalent cation/H(+) antiporter subunit G [Limoniibacter endophyticus]